MTLTPDELDAAIAAAQRSAEVAGRAEEVLEAAGLDVGELHVAVSGDTVVVAGSGLDGRTRDRVVASLGGSPDLAGYRIRIDGGDARDDGAATDDGAGDAATSMLFELAPESSAEAAYRTGLRRRDDGDLAGAEQWWRRAAGHGHAEALQAYRILLRRQARTEEAIAFLTGLAGQGMAAAAHQLGVSLVERGRHDEAERWLGRAAEAGHALAATTCGVMWVRADELGRARPWFERAVRLGDPDAAEFLAHLDRLDGQDA